MRRTILYLDSAKSRTVMKALSKYGELRYAPDIHSALVLMTEVDFDYFFIDADTPQAHAFLKHLQHDPQLVPPSGTVLVTGNDDEDCAAWSVDTFVTRARAAVDVPFIFSHLRNPTPNPENVVTIAQREKIVRAGTSGMDMPQQDNETSAPRNARETLENEDKKDQRRIPVRNHPSCDDGLGIASNARSRMATGFRLTAAMLLLISIGLWLFAWGPFATRGVSDRTSNTKRVQAESRKTESHKTSDAIPTDYVAQSSPALATPTSTPVTRDTSAVAQQTSGENSASNSASQGDESAIPTQPSAPAENHSPSVSINGRTMVHVGESITYYASASDPDGDKVSYSWGSPSKTTEFQSPGAKTISVTVTDSHGLSASSTISIMVVQ